MVSTAIVQEVRLGMQLGVRAVRIVDGLDRVGKEKTGQILTHLGV